MAQYINKISLKENKYTIRFSGKADEVIAQIKETTNEKGYFNWEIGKKKEIGKYGETHYIKVSEWNPDQKKEDKPKEPEFKDDLPF